MIEPQLHIPVLLSEVLQALGVDSASNKATTNATLASAFNSEEIANLIANRDLPSLDSPPITTNKLVIDVTFGQGGYSKAILANSQLNILALDTDPSVIVYADEIKKKYPSRFCFVQSNFAEITDIFQAYKSQNPLAQVVGIVADLGVSSMQIDTPERGFSFSKQAKLDMRMNPQSGLSAYQIINSYSEEKLADIIYKYGEEPLSRQIAQRIVTQRANQPIETTSELAGIISACYAKKYSRKSENHPATKTFQALRIYINNELDSIERLLNASIDILENSGRIVIVSFHSLEDRIIKNFFLNHSSIKKTKKPYEISKNKLSYGDIIKKQPAVFNLHTKKPITPSQEEIQANPRSRSSKLRFAEKQLSIDS